ncbi:MAG: serine protein kinase PrkA [Candidatus Nealsonbacteria bacterium]|nr:serine protein kinase PrkA [Candidatus Nealsonbacteria bacterium]
MILEKPVVKIVHAGKPVYDFQFFREGKKHIIGWFNEINDFVSFDKDAAEGSSAKEMAFVLVGEPGNGKTFFVDFICQKYRQFISRPENRRYTFEFVNLDQLGGYGNITTIQSQTFENPVILAMNLFGSREENKEFLRKAGFEDKQIELLFEKYYSPLGACTEYIWRGIRDHCAGDIEKALEFVRVVPIPIAESLGTLTGKYSAKDKITASSVDLLGEESLTRLLNLTDTNNPYRLDLRKGAIARVAGGGIHFPDEMLRNKKDLVQIYLQLIQNRNIELDGFRWPIDTLIIATSNNDVYNTFVSEKEESPIKDRCRICFVSHNTDYKLQQELTAYSLGSEKKETFSGETMHVDPNLIYAASVGVILTRLPHSEKLTPIETMKLEAGEIAGEKGVKALIEVKEDLNASPDVTKRWGQKGLGHRDLGRSLQVLMAMPESNEGKCMFAKDIFKALERVILDYVSEAADRDKFMEDLKVARQLYREQVKTAIFNAYRDDPEAIRKDVMAYVNMVVGLDAENLGPDKMWRYRDPQTGDIKSIKIDQRYIDSVEGRLSGLSNKERKESFRNTIRKVYGQKVSVDPNYDFMDNQDLVKAVTDVRLESDVAGAGSLVGALANRTNEENVRIYNRMIETMFKKLKYCPTCAQKTIEYFCEKEDES